MTNQILFVDDDPSLLNTMKRNLGFVHRVHTAVSAEEAVEVVTNEGDFSVVIVDMQMPKTNGIQTIEILREHIPDAVFCMLTGNQDLTTVTQAVNEGQVFRFMNKPCNKEEISDAIEAALKKHNSIASEKKLVSGTFAGSIKLVTDLIESQDQQAVDTGRMAAALTDLAARMSIQLGWEETVAARVFTLGIAMLDREQSTAFLTLDPTTSEHKAIFEKVCKRSASMLSRLPRLGWIVELVKAVPKANRFDPSADREEIAAILLRVVFYWNFLTSKGLSIDLTTSMIQSLIPGLSSKLIREMQNLHDNHDVYVISRTSVSDLKPGMIPGESLEVEGVGTVVSKGHPLTQAVINNLAKDEHLSSKKVAIIGNSMSAI